MGGGWGVVGGGWGVVGGGWGVVGNRAFNYRGLRFKSPNADPTVGDSPVNYRTFRDSILNYRAV